MAREMCPSTGIKLYCFLKIGNFAIGDMIYLLEMFVGSIIAGTSTVS